MREKDYLEFLCNTADGVFIVDTNKRIVRWNRGAEKILGYSETDVLNRECYRVISGKAQPGQSFCSQNCRIHSSVFKGAPQKNFDVQAMGSDGNPLWLNISTLAHLDGEEPFLAHIFRDISQEKSKALTLEQFLSDLSAREPASRENQGERTAFKNVPATQLKPSDKSAAALSAREIEVLTLLAEGLPTKSLAQKLNISHFTARNHIQNILVKLSLHSKAQAVSYAFKKGIL
ncbi:MAG: PAS domain-containing protein [Acidobacteria bacterium]|nr:PAS domain-containing protein [Acidobacteriota bacterium]